MNMYSKLYQLDAKTKRTEEKKIPFLKEKKKKKNF